jgi:hypothetical protein
MQLFDYDGYIENLIANYKGEGAVLGNAIGMLVLGRYVGWRVVRLVYSQNTYMKYRDILGVDIKDVVPERGRLARKSLALAILDKIGGFWDLVSHGAGPDRVKACFRVLE